MHSSYLMLKYFENQKESGKKYNFNNPFSCLWNYFNKKNVINDNYNDEYKIIEYYEIFQ